MASIVASFTLMLLVLKILSTFSITIMASSTTKPIAKISPNRVKRLIEKPATYNPANVPIIDTGIASIGIMVALKLPKNR